MTKETPKGAPPPKTLECFFPDQKLCGEFVEALGSEDWQLVSVIDFLHCKGQAVWKLLMEGAQVGEVIEQVFVLREVWQQSLRYAVVERQTLCQVCNPPPSQLETGLP